MYVSYISQAVPQVLVVRVAIAELAQVSHDAALENLFCQEVSEHVQNTCSLVGGGGCSVITATFELLC